MRDRLRDPLADVAHLPLLDASEVAGPLPVARPLSALAAMRDIVATTSAGSLPIAVSAESIRASVPSKTALATSLTSARVGAGATIIDSSICVAVTTGVPTSTQWRRIRFCRCGTSSNGQSIPRSPRATITAPAASVISTSCSRAAAVSILATIRDRSRTTARSSSTSPA